MSKKSARHLEATKSKVEKLGKGKKATKKTTTKADAVNQAMQAAAEAKAKEKAQAAGSSAEAQAKAEPKKQGMCPACGRTIELPNGRGRCECGQGVVARFGKLVRIKETPPGCVDLPAAKTLAEAKTPAEPPLLSDGLSDPDSEADEDRGGKALARRKAKSAKKGDGKLSGLDAAAKVLAEAGEPLDTKTMVDRMLAQGLWATGGKTPAATIYAAIIREIGVKGDASRFRKTDRGKFTLAK